MFGRIQGLVVSLFAAAVGAAVVAGGVLSRELDGGIFLSTSSGISRGLPLYSGVWDNKDPLFYVASYFAAAVVPALAFVLDWLWIPLAGVGAYLMARRVVTATTAVVLGAVITPVLLIGPIYEPGLTSTPGTALALLCLGLLMNRWFATAGICIGLLVFLKIVLVPAIALCALTALVALPARQSWLRLLTGLLGAVGVAIGGLFVLGWLPGYLTMVGRNVDYSSAVMTYFGYDPSWQGHLSKFIQDPGPGPWMFAVPVVILAAGLSVLAYRRGALTREQALAIAWLGDCLLGVGFALANTYVWEHHAMAVSLVSVIAVAVLAFLAALVPWKLVAGTALVVGTVILSGWSSISDVAGSLGTRFSGFPTAIVEVGEYPRDARLLNTVPMSNFTFARLGSNDDRGFLGSVRPGAVLSCPEFHAYDFSPAETFARLYACIGSVDVILVTDAFATFGQGVNAANARPILDYVDVYFDCLRLDDRRVCTRTRGIT